MDIEKLKTFITIIDTGSMTAAAARLRLTQPALSRTIKALEDEIGTELFERVGRGLVLSTAGRALEPDARSLLDAGELLAAKMRRVSALKYFDLRLGAVDSILAYGLAPPVDKIRKRHPGINIKITADRSPALISKVERMELDYAAVAFHGTPPKSVRSRKIVPYRMRYYGRRDLYPDLEHARTQEDVARFPVIMLHNVQDAPHCEPLPESYALTGSMATTKSLIMSGFGVGPLVNFMVSQSEMKQLVASRKNNDDEDCHVWLIAPPDSKPEWSRDIGDLLADELSRQLKTPR